MGILDRITRIAKSYLNTTSYNSPFGYQNQRETEDEELKRIIEELNAPKSESAPRQQQRKSSSLYPPEVRKAYKMLGLREGSSKDEIKQAYRRFMRAYHPDRVAAQSKEKQDEAKLRTQEANEAYEILGSYFKF